MPGKPYIKTGNSTWTKVKRIYIKSGGQTWAPIRKAYIKVRESGSVSGRWAKFYDTTSNRPFIEGNDRPKIRLNTFRTNSTYDPTGTANDPVNPVVEAPPVQQMGPPTTTPTSGWPSGTIGNHLWGYDGDWRSGNGSAITYTYQWLYNLSGDRNDNTFDPAFSPAYSSTTNASNTSSTGRADMLTNNSTYLGRGFPGQSGTEGDYFDKNFLTFRVVATNSAGSVAEESDTQLYIVRQRPSGTIDLINTSVDVPETLSASFTYSNEWYRKPNLSNSYIEWFAIDSAGETLTTSNRVAIEYLSNVIGITGTTTKSGTVYHNATVPNKFYTVRITLNNSNTESAVIPISGFIPNSPFTQEDSTAPGSTLSVTTLNILDYYNNEGTDNRGYIPVGGLFKIQSNVTGVDGSTTYRIRYRMYNWQTGTYYGMDGTNYGSAASSAWTTRTGSSSSFGFGGTLINNITVSGTTATLLHNEVISSSLFGSTTFTGGQDRWQIEIEVSALKNSVRKYYADVVGGIPYYVSRPATLSLTASPASAQVNETVTLNGIITALGGGLSYPRQYKVSFGDGTDSGWLPSGGGYAYGTSNPTFSITKQYSAVGQYYPTLTTIPDYSSASAYVNVSAALSGATSTSVVSMSRLNDTTVRAYIGSSGASGPYYQLFWTSQSTAPSTASYDAASTTSTVMEDFGFSPGTIYFYVRSSSENLGDTTVVGSGTAGTFSSYGPTTGAAFYTFASPSGATSSVNGSSAVGSTLTLTANSPTSAAPSASMTSIVWVVNDGGFGGNSFTGGSVLQNGGTTFVIPQYLYGSVSSVGYSIRAEVTWNNGVGSQTANSTGTAVTAAGVAPSGGSVTLSPSGTQQAGTTITANVSAMSGTATISYTTTLRKKTGSAPTSSTDGTEVASGSGTGNVASHTITTLEASGTPDQFRAFTTGTNSFGNNTVSSNTVISTPLVVTQYTISWNANGGSVSPGSNTVNSGTTVSAPTPTRSGYTFLYWRDSPNVFSYIYQINPGGSWTVTSNITFYAYWQIVAVASPTTPTGLSVSGSGAVTWNASSGSDSYDLLIYTATNSSGSGQLGPYSANTSSTSFQLTSSQGYSSPNNWARVQVRGRNNSGQVSTYGAWYPSSTTYV